MSRIGIIGIRGYGVIYSGFETFVRYLVEKSNKRKFYYCLFCRNPYQFSKFPGKNYSLVSVPTVKNKYLETPCYSLFSNIIGLFKKLDVVLYLGLVHAPFIFIQKMFGRKIIINTDGLDWQRKRWNFLGKFYLKTCEQLAVIFADVIICDSQTISQYFKKKYSQKNIVYIPYGSEINIRRSGSLLKKLNLEPKKYIHFVGRLTPENCVEDLIKAFKKIGTSLKCVIVGDSVYENDYKKCLLQLAGGDKRIVFTGFLSGKDYEELCSNSALYVETKGVGGTHPSLLEAVAFRNPIIAKNVSFHKEVLGEYALYYANPNQLATKIKRFLNHKTTLIKKSILLREKVSQRYSWKKVIKEYEELCPL
ncbi:DUF1972 domain-containing protein [Candidatus Roizmanbacteria bacterium]|nr:DUF1972 domain-containing protein [Candidatus Roizmanbacteria bacterium]